MKLALMTLCLAGLLWAPAAEGRIDIISPLDGTVYPKDFAPPWFRWQDSDLTCDSWLIRFEFGPGSADLQFTNAEPRWRPSVEIWHTIKQGSLTHSARVTIAGLNRSQPESLRSSVRMVIRTSPDEVGAPIIFREVSLPLSEAASDPGRLQWKLGSVASPHPLAAIMQGLPVCGNCHSFSSDGKWFSMDIDYPNKSGLVWSAVDTNIILTKSDLFSWEAPGSNGDSFGLLAQLSPKGDLLAATIRDLAVFRPIPELSYSQLFFPIRGVLAFRSREGDAYQELPGADDPDYVQTNPAWSPDGQFLVFARSRAYPVPTNSAGRLDRNALDRAFGRRPQPFKYDLYRIPFNGGRGGQAEPLAGASRNGKSNFFPRYSPDGRWIVFCQASNYMMLQPDSELFIVPAAGGPARRLLANTDRMNSWHSWSPNSKWLVFASKAQSPYTQLYLTHIDEQGESSPALWLDGFSSPDLAANLPEFVPGPRASIQRIEMRLALDLIKIRDGNEYLRQGKVSEAIRNYRAALAENPQNAEAHQRLGLLLYHRTAQQEEGLEHLAAAVRLAPGNAYFHHDLGVAWLHRGRIDAALPRLNEAVSLMQDAQNPVSVYNPNDTKFHLGLMLSPRHARYRLINPPPEIEFDLGLGLFLNSDYARSAEHLLKAVSMMSGAANNAKARYLLALSLAAQGRAQAALPHWQKARELNPEIESAFTLEALLGPGAKAGERFQDLTASARESLASYARPPSLSQARLLVEQ
jgi:tetratricopeptide (TPR) repeat protein